MRRLGTSRAATIGHLHMFWWWCLDYAPDGELTHFDNEELAIAAEWEGDADTFANAMIESGFIDSDYGLTFVHDWDQYGGKLLARKETNRNRMREARASYKPNTETPNIPDVSERATHVQSTCNERAKLEESREEESREEESINGTVATDAAPKRNTKGTRFAADADLSKSWIVTALAFDFTEEEIDGIFLEFRDYWCAVPGAKGVKLDWLATWRNHLRRHLERRANIPTIGNRANVETFNGNPVFDHRGNPTTAYFLRQVEQLEAEEREGSASA
jgi:hypothetical protein